MSPLARANPADPKREFKTGHIMFLIVGVGHTFAKKKCFGVAGGANMAPGP